MAFRAGLSASRLAVRRAGAVRGMASEHDPPLKLFGIPEAEARESHGAPGWHTGGKSGKFFAYFNDQHHGEPHVAVLVKTSGPDELAAMVARDPDIWFRPAYYGASGWAGLILNRPGVDWDHVAEWVERSWRAVAPKRLSALRSAADEF